MSEILLESRRRCCICFGLNRNTSIRQGQIAHIDGNRNNNSKDNLAFLCFDHHDQLDSKTSQSKNFTSVEVKRFREELHSAITEAFSKPITFGEVEAVVGTSIEGHYLRTYGNDSAELKITLMQNGNYHVSGIALHGTDREYGPNIGELDFITAFENGLKFKDSNHRPPYQVSIKIENGSLVVEEENEFGYFGVGARFGGTYERAT